MYLNYNSTGGAGAHLRFYANGTNQRGYADAGNGDLYWGNNLRVSTANTTGNGIFLADDGSIVDNNDGFATHRFSLGLRITDGINSNTTVARIGANGNINTTRTVSARALTARGVQYVADNNGQNDNVDHQMYCTGGWAMMNFSVYVSSRFEGDFRANCANLDDILTTSGEYWQYSQHGCGNADNTWYDMRCAGNHLMRGIVFYATGQLDYCPRILCSPLVNGASTSGSFVANPVGPNTLSNATGPDNSNMSVSCPPGTYITGLSWYASSHADGGLYGECSGINLPY
jgi:hypothetical protein